MTTAVAYGCFTEATILGAGAKSMSGPASVLSGVRKEMTRTKIRKGTQKRLEFASGAECYTCSGQNCFRLNLNLESTKIKDALFLFLGGGYFRTVRSPAFIGFQVTLVLLLDKWQMRSFVIWARKKLRSTGIRTTTCSSGSSCGW